MKLPDNMNEEALPWHLLEQCEDEMLQDLKLNKAEPRTRSIGKLIYDLRIAKKIDLKALERRDHVTGNRWWLIELGAVDTHLLEIKEMFSKAGLTLKDLCPIPTKFD